MSELKDPQSEISQMNFGLLEESRDNSISSESMPKPKPEIPMNYKWFRGEFHTASWGSEQSPFAGRSKGRVKVAMMGKTMRPTIHNGIASVYGTIEDTSEEEDKLLIGQSGWWKLEDLSTETKKRKKI